MSQHDTLEPCPFCGALPDDRDVGDYFVSCPSCGIDGPAGLSDGREAAANAWNRRAALSATQPAQAAQGEPTLRDYAADLVDAGHDFWKACEREAGGGAVRWLSCDDGTLIVFTRVEYRDEIMAHVRGYKAPVVVFDEDGMTALEAQAAADARDAILFESARWEGSDHRLAVWEALRVLGSRMGVTVTKEDQYAALATHQQRQE